MIDETHAPGRKVMKRHNGRRDVYWIARPDAVRAGYRPRTVKLDDPGEATAPPEIAARCRVMWAEMLEFLAGSIAPGRCAAAGSIRWLADLYETDPDSPIHRLRPSTREMYARNLAIVKATVGERRLDVVTAGDLRRWFKAWGRADESGRLASPRRAYACVQLLRIVMKYGAGQRLPGCRALSEILTETEFPAPKGRREAMTGAQALALIAKARESGFPSIALAVALQFGCGLRQKDVIGEWIKLPAGQQWQSGLRWGEHVKPDWRLEKPTSKSNFSEIAEFDLRLLPSVMAELQLVAPTSRIGPVILDESTRRPYRQRAFAERFRRIARAAGLPDSLYNMDARAGAVTDAYARGAAATDVMDLATHTQLSTSRRYSRNRQAATDRVSVLRFGDAGKKAD